MLRKHFVSVVLSLILLTGVALVGCNKTSSTAVETKSKPAASQILSWNPGGEPGKLDPQLSDVSNELTIETALFEGLTRLDKNDSPVPGIAEKWEISNDGLIYTFHLRDAKWSNGEAISAEDFRYAWLRALSPDTGASYAYQLWYIKNAQGYTEKSLSADAVAIKVLDPKTLQVELVAPTPYFLSLTAFPTLFPVNKATVDKNPADWTQTAEKYVSNGPFILKEWKHDDKLVVIKNANYWDASAVQLTEITFSLINDAKSALTAFEQGSLNGTVNIPADDLERLNKSGLLKNSPNFTTYFYSFNVNRKPFDDLRVRQALSLAIDRKLIVDKVAMGGQTPAYAFVPEGIPGANGSKTFREEGGDYIKEDVIKAKELLSASGYPDGKGFPEVAIMYNMGSSHEKIAQAIQDMWKKNLGIDIKLQGLEPQVYREKIGTQDFDIVRVSWGADYIDAMTFIDLFTSAGMNPPGWQNSSYDQLVEDAKKSAEQSKRIQNMHDAEKLLVQEMPIVPIYYGVNNYVAQPFIKDMYYSPLGIEDFKLTWIVEH